MFRLQVFGGFLGLAILLSGCQADSGTFGPTPVISASQVKNSTNNRIRILSSLRIDAAGGTTDPVSWYDVTRAGFNFVDDQCTTYFNRLFKLRRQDEAFRSGINAFSATSNAILALTGASTLSMTAVAQAFNLSYKLSEINSNTFLYSLPPSETSEFVKKIQRAYRDGVAQESYRVDNATESYHQIQEYLNLCLPQTIEARLVSHVSDVEALPASGAPGGEVKVVLGSSLGALDKARLAEVKNSSTILKGVGEAPNLPGSKNSYEKQLSEPLIGTIQTALCVDVDYAWGPATRAAVVEFYNGLRDPRPKIAQTGVTGADMVQLRKAMRMHPTCGAPNAHTSAFGLGEMLKKTLE